MWSQPLFATFCKGVLAFYAQTGKVVSDPANQFFAELHRGYVTGEVRTTKFSWLANSKCSLKGSSRRAEGR